MGLEKQLNTTALHHLFPRRFVSIFASPNCETDTHADVALLEGGNNLFKATNSVVRKMYEVHSRVLNHQN